MTKVKTKEQHPQAGFTFFAGPTGMVGSMVSAILLTLIVVPAIYVFVLEHRLKQSENYSHH